MFLLCFFNVFIYFTYLLIDLFYLFIHFILFFFFGGGGAKFILHFQIKPAPIDKNNYQSLYGNCDMVA